VLNVLSPISVWATIRRSHPHLLVDSSEKYDDAEPIPLVMPVQLLEKQKKFFVEGIGEPVTACFLTGANVDPTNWLALFHYA